MDKMEEEGAGTSESSQLQVRFVTKQKQYSVPDTTFAVASSVTTKELNTLLNQLLNEDGERRRVIEFEFLALGEFVRAELGLHVSERGGCTESVLQVEYVERLPAPQPKDCLLHDDWVSSVHVDHKRIVSGCYDGTVHLWTTKGEHVVTLPGHTECVKDVSWVAPGDRPTLVSCSHDQTLLLWEWNAVESRVERVQVCKGHTRGVECLAVSPDKRSIASGSWDNMLKIWSADLNAAEEDRGDDESEAKRAKKLKKGKLSQTRSPVMTLSGHREVVSGLCWSRDDNLVSCSWDHSLRVWDPRGAACIREIPANKAMFDVDVNPFNSLLLVASADRHLRLIDSKSSDSLVVKCTLSSHSQWVQAVRWSPCHENLFISGAYDNLLKLWDTRSPKVPLYDMRGHEDKILCCDWSDPALMVSGGADNTVRVFKSSNHPAAAASSSSPQSSAPNS